MKNKILFLIPSLTVAGAEKVVVDLAERLADNEYKVGIISLSEDVPFFSRLRNKNKIKLYTCGKSTFRFPWFSLKRWSLLKKAIKEFNPNIIHSHLWSFHCVYLLALANKIKTVKFFHTVHISDSHYTDKRFIYKIFTQIEVSSVKFCKAKVVSISDEVHLLSKNQLNFKDVIKISNGIDTDYFKPYVKDVAWDEKLKIPEGFKVLINIGRYDKQKGQINIIEALKILLDSDHKNYILLFIGKDIEQHLNAMVISYNLQANVRFLGVCDRIQELIAVADLGVFPSLYEGFGLACGEMMSCELPTIISDISPLLEISNNGAGAYITPTGDSKAIAHAIIELSEKPDLRKQLGEKGREIIKNRFSLEKQVQRHIRLYEE